MKIKKLLMIGLVSSLLLIPKNVSAAPAESNPNTTHVKSENVSEAKVPEDEIAELENFLGLNYPHLLAAVKDRHEPNDTIETAFPYRDTEKIACMGNKDIYGHFQCFYTPNTISDIDDIDFFKISLQEGKYYVAILKNVYSDQVRDICLYYQKPDGSWWYKYPTTKDRGNSLFHFTAEASTYYIRLSGDYAPGQSSLQSNYWNWFAVERDGTIDERIMYNDPKPAHALQ